MKPQLSILKNLVLVFLSGFFLSGCDSSDEPAINCSASGLTLTLVSTTPSSCGTPSGSLTISGSGGMAPLTYSIDGTNFQSSEIFEPLTAGTYTVVVKDANDCIASLEVMVEGEGDLDLSLASTSAECQETNGSLTATATGGTPGYMFKINNGSFQPSADFSGLGSGNYNVTVSDTEGCEVTKSHRVFSDASWQQDILPIINTRCALSGCHDGMSGPPNWTNLSTVQQNAQNIKNRTGARIMPPSGAVQLTDAQIAVIACWVDDGARNN